MSICIYANERKGFEIYVHFTVVLFCLNIRAKISKQIFMSVVIFYEFNSFRILVYFIQMQIVIHNGRQNLLSEGHMQSIL